MGQRVVALDNPQLRDVLRDIANGSIQLPDFQRDWKWDDERISALLATVSLDYPLGVVMTLATGGAPQFKPRPLSGAAAAVRPPDQLLLDGQQRLTSLFQALHADRPVETVDVRGNKIKRWYYIDIEAAIKDGADREDAIVSVPEDRLLRRDFGRRTELDLSTTDLECAAGYFPLNIALDAVRTGKWQQAYVERLGSAGWSNWSLFTDRVLHKIGAFQVPMIRLAADTRKEAVCSVFERVNTGGVALNVFELLTATYAGDQSYFAEEGHDFNLGDVWRSVKQDLSRSYPALGTVENGQEGGLTSSDFLQAVSLVLTFERKEVGRAAAVACKRRDLLNLPLTEFRRLCPAVAEGFAWVGGFLARQFVFRNEDLPYRTQLVPMAAVHALLAGSGHGIDAEAEALIARWYWCGVFGEMYGSTTESRMPRDVEQLMAKITDPGSDDPDTIQEASFQAQRLDRLISRNSAAYKGLYAQVARQGAVDWFFTEGSLSQEIIVGQSVDIRQIFPKGWVGRHHGKKDQRGTSIVNKTPLSYRASRSMTGAPSDYLPALARESGTPEPWFDDLVSTHLIDPKLLRADNFDEFYRDRSERLLALIQDAMGKPIVRREGEQ